MDRHLGAAKVDRQSHPRQKAVMAEKVEDRQDATDCPLKLENMDETVTIISVQIVRHATKNKLPGVEWWFKKWIMAPLFDCHKVI